MKARQQTDPELALEQVRVRALARELVFDADLARDVEQEVLLAALANTSRQPAALFTRLANLVRGFAYRAQRSDRRRAARERQVARSEGSVPSACEILEREEQRRNLIERVLALDPPLRAVLVLRFFEELAPREVARRLGVPLETVRTRQKRGLALLREQLDRESRGDRGAWCAALVSGLNLRPSGTQLASSLISSLPAVIVMAISKQVILAPAFLLLLAGLAWLGLSISKVDRRAQSPSALAATAAVEGPVDAEHPDSSRKAHTSATGRVQVASAEIPAASATPAEGALLLRVTWEDGTPAAEIGGFFQVADSRSPFEGTRAVRTTAEGTCHIEHVPAGRVRVELDRTRRGSVEVKAGETSELALTIPNGIDVHGLVIDVEGRPVADAEIFAERGDLIGYIVGRSGPDGRFVIRALSRQPFWISARAPFRAPTPQEYVWGMDGAAGSRTHDVRLVFLERGGALAGVVLDEQGDPVVDAQVLVGLELNPGLNRITLPDRRDAYVAAAQRVPVDARGRFHFAGVPSGRQPVWVRAPGFGLWKGDVPVIEGQLAQLEIRLLAGSSVEGVLRNVAGHPIAGLPIVLIGSSAFHHRSAMTAQDGSYRLEDLPTGEFELVVYQNSAPTKVAARFLGAPGAELRWDPVLGSHLSIRGRIVTEQDPTQLTVWCTGRGTGAGPSTMVSAVPDPSGRFEIPDRDDVPHRISVGMGGSSEFLLEVDDVRPSGDEIAIELGPERWPSVRLAGRVLDAAGQPRGSTVRVIARDRGTTARATSRMWETDATGAFDIGPYPPGRWRVEVMCWPLLPGAPLAVSAEAEVSAGKTWDFGDLIVPE